MSFPTEREILQRLTGRLRLAAEDCDRMSWHPLRGRVYERLREKLGQIGGDCLRLAVCREDDRWNVFSMRFSQAHKIAGDCLRQTRSKAEREKIGHPFFVHLAIYMRQLVTVCDNLANRKTERAGMILPKAREGPLRQGRPVQVLAPGLVQRKSGLIVPREMVNG